MDNVVLKPCPLCGNHKITIEQYDPYDGYQGNCSTWLIACKNCDCNVSRADKTEVIDIWNNRKLPKLTYEHSSDKIGKVINFDPNTREILIKLD